MSFSDQEKERIRYHLGYPEVQPAASIQLGIPRPIQTAFLVESAMNLVIPAAEARIRKMLQILENLECQLQKVVPALQAEQLGNLKPRENAPDLIEKEYVRWAKRLADVLGVPLYAYSDRFKNVGAGYAGSIPVRR